MNTKTCKRCGWVYPITQPGIRCKLCGEPFETVVCTKCGKLFKWFGRKATCRACEAASSPEKTARFRARLKARFDQWLDKVKQVPKDYPTLTEEQWLEACNYFNGCARCDSEEIDTRGFFVGRDNGGRYCDWNVIPLCTKCAKIWRLEKSMFDYTYYKDIAKNSRQEVVANKTEFRDNLENIVKYLEVKLNNAIRVSEDPDVDATGSKHTDS